MPYSRQRESVMSKALQIVLSIVLPLAWGLGSEYVIYRLLRRRRQGGKEPS